jgi:hypothetical protein
MSYPQKKSSLSGQSEEWRHQGEEMYNFWSRREQEIGENLERWASIHYGDELSLEKEQLVGVE